jgi:hypothetical protein
MKYFCCYWGFMTKMCSPEIFLYFYYLKKTASSLATPENARQRGSQQALKRMVTTLVFLRPSPPE